MHLFGCQFLHDSGGVSMFQRQCMFLSFPWRSDIGDGDNTLNGVHRDIERIIPMDVEHRLDRGSGSD